MLLKRQDDSEGSDPPPSPVPAPDGSGPDLSLREKLQNDSLKLSFDIDSVGSGLDTLPEYMEKVGEAIGDRAGVLMVEYLKRILAINGFLEGWPRDLGDDIVKFIKAGLGDAEYSEVEPALTMRVQRARDAIQNSLQEAMDALSKILGRAGSVINNVEMASRSFGGLFYSYREFFRALGYQLGRFEAGKISSEYFTNIGTSIDMFMEKQLGLHNELLKTLKVAPSN
ncbi:hypothetical protein BASA62_002692 [Batrachochytrium salamandrivorans]|nr:hypothetical protein BASA62_002692 [Batrachochytrium salamandrivorans]